MKELILLFILVVIALSILIYLHFSIKSDNKQIQLLLKQQNDQILDEQLEAIRKSQEAAKRIQETMRKYLK